MSKQPYLHLFLISLVLSLLLSACAGAPDETTTQTTEQAAETTTEAATAATTTQAETTEAPAEETDPPEDILPGGQPELIWHYQHENKLESIGIAPDGQTLAVGEYLTAYVHRLADGILVDVFTYFHSVEDVQFSPDSSLMAAGLTLDGVVINNLTDGSEIKLHGGYNSRLAISPDGSVIATGNRDGAVWLWQIDDGELIAELISEQAKWLVALDFHPDGNRVAASQWTNDGLVQIWDITSGQVVSEIVLNQSIGGTANLFRFSPDGSQMAGAFNIDWNYFIQLWTVDGTEMLAEWPSANNVKDLDYSPDGRMLAVLAQTEAAIYSADTGELLYTLDQTIDPDVNDWNVALSFTPDGGHLAIVRWNGAIELWRLPGAQPLVAPPIDIRVPPPLPGDVLFDTASAVLKEAAFPELEALAEELLTHFTTAEITFIGHTDSRGSAESNLSLSLERAESIRAWFSDWADENDADGWTLLVDGRGDTELKVPDTDTEGTFLEDAGALNRRVEIEIETAD